LVQLAPFDINPWGIPPSEERQGVGDVVYLVMGVAGRSGPIPTAAPDAGRGTTGKFEYESSNTSAKLPTQNIDLPYESASVLSN
jgi:hypothetical protein